jgi:hypothetical protein
MRFTRPALVASAGILLLLAACDDHSSSPSSSSSSSPPAAQTPQAQISSQFAADFNAPMNSTPPKPSPSDLPPVSLTGTPIALH